MWECSCLKFITGSQMATIGLKCRSVMEPYSGTHEACLRICVGKWISEHDSKAGDSNRPRAVICWQRILQPTVRGGGNGEVCVCVRDRTGGLITQCLLTVNWVEIIVFLRGQTMEQAAGWGPRLVRSWSAPLQNERSWARGHGGKAKRECGGRAEGGLLWGQLHQS